MIKKLVTTAINDLLNLFYPNVCLLCSDALHQEEELICTACRLALPHTNQHASAEGLKSNHYKFAGKGPVDFVYSYLHFTKKGKTQRLVHALKYRGRKEVGHLIGRWYGYQLKTETTIATEIDLIAGVPLHPAKLRQRGYNQSDWFAMGLSASLDVPWSDALLQRSKYTVSQTGKDRMGRWENVSEVFKVADKKAIENKRILLVDDVLTTGATLEACTATLLNAGCQSVGIITIAATQ